MSDEIEAAGALATATLAANVVEGASPARGAHSARCANCGAVLAGAYCNACGQPAHVHRSLWHLAEEVLHGILHFDAKGWRTLPLLVFRPGLLTRRYIDGQRARHVSPLALFLFSVFLMFFVFSFTPTLPIQTTIGGSADIAEARAEIGAQIAEAASAAAGAESDLERAQARGDRDAAADAQAAFAAAKTEQQALVLATKAIDVAQARSVASGSASAVQGTRSEALPRLDIRFGNAGLDNAVQRAMENPDLLLYKLKNTAYKFSFLLVLISFPFLWLMFFRRPGIVMYDHAVFALYSLSFMSVLFIGFALLEPWQARNAQALLVLVVAPLHMFMHLLETYRLGLFAALWRTAVLAVVCATVLLLFLVLILAFTTR